MKSFNHSTLFSLIIVSLCCSIFMSCKKDEVVNPVASEQMVDVGEFELFTTKSGEGTITVVFEAGMGNNYKVWEQTDVLGRTGKFAQTLAYNRAGYAPSGIGTEPRTIPQLVSELHTVIEERVTTDQIILVGHSWGGPVIRAYAIKHPEKVAGMLFIDPTHEAYINFTQYHEETILMSWGNAPGREEAEQFLEGIEYISDLPNLPDVPVRVLTSMKTTADLDNVDRQKWFNAHEKLGQGISDFNHIGTLDSGHYIQLEQVFLVMDAIRELAN